MSRFTFRDYWGFFTELLSGRRAGGEVFLAETIENKFSARLDFSQGLSILDIGSGALQPQFLLQQARGHDVVGIDFVNGKQGSLIERLGYALAKRLYWYSIPAKSRQPGPSSLLCADAGKIPLADEVFDLAISVAAFEHFLDVPAVVKEIHRVLKPGAGVFIVVHPFTALSGGHNLQLMNLPITTLPDGVDAWDHLRKRELPLTVPLNEWRIAQYLAEFEKYFTIFDHGGGMKEGDTFLTPEIEAELSEFTHEELLWGSYYIAGQKN